MKDELTVRLSHVAVNHIRNVRPLERRTWREPTPPFIMVKRNWPQVWLGEWEIMAQSSDGSRAILTRQLHKHHERRGGPDARSALS